MWVETAAVEIAELWSDRMRCGRETTTLLFTPFFPLLLLSFHCGKEVDSDAEGKRHRLCSLFGSLTSLTTLVMDLTSMLRASLDSAEVDCTHTSKPL